MSSIIKDISALTPTAQTAARAFLKLCGERGLKVRITETYRSQERQNELYAQGRTKSGQIVTWTKNSRHTSRRAWDICQNIKGKEYSDTAFFKSCGAAAKELGITWGGEWKTPDMPHFEVTESWAIPVSFKEELIMEELKKRIAELEARLPKRYTYTQDVPDWGRATVQKLMDRGLFHGAAADDLNLSEDLLRMMVICDNAGVWD